MACGPQIRFRVLFAGSWNAVGQFDEGEWQDLMYGCKRSLNCGVENGLEWVREAAGRQEMGQIRAVAVRGESGMDAGCGWKGVTMVWMSE